MEKDKLLNGVEDQYTISKWAEQTFGQSTAQQILKRLKLEFKELCEKLDAFEEDDDNIPFDDMLSIQYECADVVIMIVQIVNRLGGDTATLVDRKMQINRQRQWAVADNGHFQHVENKNTGHGHVNPRPDGMRARCGGPAICSVCASERRN